MNLWWNWGSAAIRAEGQAWAANARFRRGNGNVLRLELESALVATTAAAFAIEAFANQVWDRLVDGVAQEGKTPPTEPGGNAATRKLEILKLAFEIGQYQHGWVDRFDWLFKKLRDRAVHYVSESRPVELHSSGETHTDAEHVLFNAETATKAVDLYIDVLTACLNNPRPAVQQYRKSLHVLDALSEERANEVVRD